MHVDTILGGFACFNVSLRVKRSRSDLVCGNRCRVRHGQDGDVHRQGIEFGAFPPLRAGAPGRRPHRRGAPPNLDTMAARNLALHAFDREVHAALSGESF